MSVRLIIALTLCALLSSCGLKRNLQLPGHDKYTHRTQDDSADDTDDDTDNTDSQAPAKPALQPSPAAPAAIR